MSVHVSTLVWKCEEVRGADLLLLLALADMANDEGYCWPGLKSLAVRLRVTPDNARKGLNRIEQAGWVRSEPRYRPNGSQASNGYHLNLARLQGGASPVLGYPIAGAGGGGIAGAGVGASPVLPLEPSIEPSSETSTNHSLCESPSGSPAAPDGVRASGGSSGQASSMSPALRDHLLALFEQWWSHYPRKTNKKGARDIWLKLRPSRASTAVLIAAVEEQKKSEQWRRNIVPHATTWLNQERWNDELPKDKSVYVEPEVVI